VGQAPIANFDLGWNNPWGGLYSTLNDMLRLLTALNLVDATGSTFPQVLASQTLREMLLPAFMNPDSKTGQGSPFQMMYFQNKLMRTLGGSINGYSSHLISIPGLRLSMVVLANSGNVDVSPFTLEAARLLIPLIQNQLLKEELGPQPAPNATLFTTVFLGQDARGPGMLTVSADDNGVLFVADSRLESLADDLAYQLSYVGDVNNGTQRFRVTLVGRDVDSQAFLTCLNLVNLAVTNEFMDFSAFGLEHYRTLIFQGEQYQKVSNDFPAQHQFETAS